MGQVDDHAQAVELGDGLAAETGQGGGFFPGRLALFRCAVAEGALGGLEVEFLAALAVREPGHPDAQPAHDIENAEAVVEQLAALKLADQSDFVLGLGAKDVVGRVRDEEIPGMLVHVLVHAGPEVEALGEVRAADHRVHRRQAAGLHPPEINLVGRPVPAEIVGFLPRPMLDERIVVAVDDDGFFVEREGLRGDLGLRDVRPRPSRRSRLGRGRERRAGFSGDGEAGRGRRQAAEEIASIHGYLRFRTAFTAMAA